ncbi:MAG TPA: class I SAM-dependent methyltransferase [Gemmatimonadales bacterium]
MAEGLGGVALDYGAGWGDITALLARQFDRIVGVDIDPARVEFAAAEWAPIEFSECSDHGVAFGNASFDAVFSIVVMHFSPSADAYLAECRRVLRPDGTLVIVIQSPESMWRVIRRMRGRLSWDGGIGAESLQGFREVLERGGFTIDRTAGFFDPPFDRMQGPADLLLSIMNGVGQLLGFDRHWSYVGFRCRRVA